jgi:hypothetical protein
MALSAHGLDPEPLDLARLFGRRVLAHAELREVFVEHQSLMQGLAHRLLGLAGLALGLGIHYFADMRSTDPARLLTLEGEGSSTAFPSRGLIALRQGERGEVTAWIGEKLARQSAGRWIAAAAPALPVGGLALRFELDAARETGALSRRHIPRAGRIAASGARGLHPYEGATASRR